MKQEISISSGTLVRILAILACAYALWVLRDLALLVLSAVVLASAIEPGIESLMKYRIPRVFSVIILYGVVFLGFFALLYVFIPPVIEDSQKFLVSVPEYLQTLNLPESVVSGPETQHAEGQAQSALDTLQAFRVAFSDPSQGVVRLVASFFGGIFSLALVIVLSFYFALQETGVDDFLKIVTPSKYENYVVGLWRRAKKKIGLWMQGQLLLSVIVGVLAYLGLLILGVPYALLLAVLASIFDLIPIFGSPFAGILAAIVAFSAGGVTLALLVAGLYFIINQFEANLLYPLVVKKVVGVPPLLVIIALIAGGTLAGFVGVLLSVPFAAALREFIDDLDKNKRARA